MSTTVSLSIGKYINYSFRVLVEFRDYCHLNTNWLMCDYFNSRTQFSLAKFGERSS
jgi:hypothetical protein